jgi:GNAT superfamily N-acetyltransferase
MNNDPSSSEHHAELSFRVARNDPQDSQLFCSLSNSLYSRKVDNDYYRWQFFGPPHPCILSFAIDENGDLAGCYGFHLPYFGKMRETIGMALDIMIAPRFQGKGVFRRLYNFAFEQIQSYNPVAVYVTPNEHADSAHVHGLGWKRINILTDQLYTINGKTELPKQNIEIFELKPNITEHEEFFKWLEKDRLKNNRGLFSILHSPAFIEWRFLKNPRYRYSLFGCKFQGKYYGYLVLKEFRDPQTTERFGDIVDIYWAEDDPCRLAEMLEFATNYFNQQGINKVTTWLQTNTLLDQIGRDMGFEPTGRHRYLCCKVLNNRYAWLEDPKRWFITMTDSEVY